MPFYYSNLNDNLPTKFIPVLQTTKATSIHDWCAKI